MLNPRMCRQFPKENTYILWNSFKSCCHDLARQWPAAIEACLAPPDLFGWLWLVAGADLL